MNSLSFPLSYIIWHYSKAFKNIFGIFSNLFFAVYNFFSIPLLFKTLLSPWHHLDVEQSKKFDFADYFGNIIVNTLMRIMGMIIRLIVICIGIVCLFLIFITEIIFFIAWILMPVIIVLLIYKGVIILSTNI